MLKLKQELIQSKSALSSIYEIQSVNLLPIYEYGNEFLLVSPIIPLNKTTKRENRSLFNRYNLSNRILKNVCNVSSNDLLVILKLKGDISVDYIDLYKYETKYKNNKIKINRFPITKETSYILGLYVADGYVSKNNRSINFSLNKNKDVYIYNKIKKYFLNIGLEIHNYIKDNVLNVNVYNTTIGKFLKDSCGDSSFNKKIPNFILKNKDKSILKSFLDGYIDGDGYRYEKGNKLQFSTVSRTLSIQLQKAYTRFNKLINIQHYHRSSHYHKSFKKQMPDYNIYQMYVKDDIKKDYYIFDKDFIYVKIRSIKKVGISRQEN